MTVAMISGFESSTQAEWDGGGLVATTGTSGQWTWAINTASKRTGTYGLECTRSASAGTGSAVLNTSFGISGTWMRPGGFANLSHPLSFRFYFNIQTWSTGTHLRQIFGLTNSGHVTGILLSGTARTLQAVAGGTTTNILNLSTATWYRIEGQIKLDGNFQVQVYTADEVTPLASQSVNAGGMGTVTGASIGSNYVFGNPAQACKLWFDDVRIDSGSAVPIGPGGVLTAVFPTSDVGTPEFTRSTGANSYATVDDLFSTTDYNKTETTGTVLRTDQLGLAAYGGANTITAVAALFHHQWTSFPGDHEFGFVYSGTEEMEDVTPQSGSGSTWYSSGLVIDTAPGGTSLHTNFGSVDVIYRRKSGGNVLKDLQIASVIVMIEDNAGVTWPPTLRRGRGCVT